MSGRPRKEQISEGAPNSEYSSYPLVCALGVDSHSPHKAEDWTDIRAADQKTEFAAGVQPRYLRKQKCQTLRRIPKFGICTTQHNVQDMIQDDLTSEEWEKCDPGSRQKTVNGGDQPQCHPQADSQTRILKQLCYLCSAK